MFEIPKKKAPTKSLQPSPSNGWVRLPDPASVGTGPFTGAFNPQFQVGGPGAVPAVWTKVN